MSHKLYKTFPRLKVYVPAVPTGSRLTDCLRGLHELDAEILAAVARVVAAGTRLSEHFAANAVTVDELPALFAPLQNALRALMEHVRADYQGLTARAKLKGSLEALRWLLPDGSPELIEGYKVCDRYFRFVRVRDMSAREWLGTMSFVALALAEDLPNVLLNWDEMLALLLALTIQFAWLLPWEAEPAAEPEPVSVSPATPIWQSEVQALGRTVAISYFRLLIGHHIWQHFTVMAHEYFERASQALTDGQDEAAAESLWKATRMFRGTTAAMWYASIFPRKTYQDELRPTMVETDSIDAQQQHLTYNQLKQAIKKLKTAFDERLASAHPLASPQLYAALKEFYEFYLQDMEQHILVATSKVGLDSSLAQKVWQATLPPNTRTKNAMDLLRDMAVMRQKEWQKVLNIPVAEPAVVA